MAEANAERREVNARIVYWGVEGAGKVSNLRAIHGKLRPDHRGRLEAVPTSLDPSVCSYRLPIELGEIAGVRTRIQIVAVPGGAEQAPTRKQLLDRVDGVVFVVDARRARIDENLAAFEELRGALAAYGRALEQMPLVVQYNHHDESDPFVLEELHRKLDVRDAAAFEARASDGTGVLPTLTTISKRVVRQLRENEQAAKASKPAPAPTGAPAPAPRRQPTPSEAPASGDAAGVGARSETQPSEAHPARATKIGQLGRPGSTPGRPSSQAPRTPAPAATPPTPVDLRTTAVVLEDPDPELDLEQAALDADVELVDERDDAVARAQGLLDVSWSELDDFAAAEPAPADAQAGGWRLVGAGVPEIVAPTTLHIPIVVADAVGRELRFRVSVCVEPLLDE
jgi:signal recognition particle receptor subunit beta